MTGMAKPPRLLTPEDPQITEEPTVEESANTDQSTEEDQTADEDQAAGEEQTAGEEQAESEIRTAEESQTEEELLQNEDEIETRETTETGGFDEPAGTSLRLPLWGAVLFAAAMIAALAIALVQSRRVRRLRHQAALRSAARRGAGSVSIDSITVGKLHEQGARQSQQDCFAVSNAALRETHGLLAVVADGMGGLADGDRVSAAATDAVLDRFMFLIGDLQPKEILLTLAGEAVHVVNALLGPRGFRKSGSTLVLGLIRDGYFSFLSIGDSRVCLYRDGILTQLNREHTYENELALQAVNGERTVSSALSDPKGAGLVSFLGMGKLAAIDLPAAPLELRAGDMLVLMSDGVYNALMPYELAAMLEGASAETAAKNICRAIREKNYSDQDNYTAVILGCEPQDKEEGYDA